jgi:hypothetical protein
MNNYRTTLLGALTIIVALATGAKEFLGTGTLPDLGLLVSSIAAGWGLLMARDAQN